MRKQGIRRRIFPIAVMLVFLALLMAGCGLFSSETGSGRCPEGHLLTHVEAELSSCMKEGNLEYWYCETCSRYFADPEGKEPVSEEETKMCEMGHGGLF